MVRLAGVDGFAGGWVAVAREASGLRVIAEPSLASLVERLDFPEVIAVDIPLGLPIRDPRRCDVEARALLGSRRSSLFETPPRVVLEADTYAEARRKSTALRGRSVSAQSYNLREKVFEAEQVAADGVSLWEVHPELSFAEMAGAPLEHPKRSWAGLHERLGVLAVVGIELPGTVEGNARVPADDVVDAAAAFWTATRIAAGQALSVPDPPETIGGSSVAIWR